MGIENVYIFIGIVLAIALITVAFMIIKLPKYEKGINLQLKLLNNTGCNFSFAIEQLEIVNDITSAKELGESCVI